MVNHSSSSDDEDSNRKYNFIIFTSTNEHCIDVRMQVDEIGIVLRNSGCSYDMIDCNRNLLAWPRLLCKLPPIVQLKYKDQPIPLPQVFRGDDINGRNVEYCGHYDDYREQLDNHTPHEYFKVSKSTIVLPSSSMRRHTRRRSLNAEEIVSEMKQEVGDVFYDRSTEVDFRFSHVKDFEDIDSAIVFISERPTALRLKCRDVLEEFTRKSIPFVKVNLSDRDSDARTEREYDNMIMACRLQRPMMTREQFLINSMPQIFKSTNYRGSYVEFQKAQEDNRLREWLNAAPEEFQNDEETMSDESEEDPQEREMRMIRERKRQARQAMKEEVEEPSVSVPRDCPPPSFKPDLIRSRSPSPVQIPQTPVSPPLSPTPATPVSPVPVTIAEPVKVKLGRRMSKEALDLANCKDRVGKKGVPKSQEKVKMPLWNLPKEVIPEPKTVFKLPKKKPGKLDDKLDKIKLKQQSSIEFNKEHKRVGKLNNPFENSGQEIQEMAKDRFMRFIKKPAKTCGESMDKKKPPTLEELNDRRRQEKKKEDMARKQQKLAEREKKKLDRIASMNTAEKAEYDRKQAEREEMLARMEAYKKEFCASFGDRQPSFHEVAMAMIEFAKIEKARQAAIARGEPVASAS